MAIYIKGPGVDRLARELARLEGTGLTEAIGRALSERHARLCAAREAKRRRVEARLARLASLPVVDAGDPDEAIYDEHGLPKA